MSGVYGCFKRMEGSKRHCAAGAAAADVVLL